jgi:hypothetical protein
VTPSSFTTWDQDIDEDTTWRLANSPYVITRGVTITQNATLEIEPGVVVLFRPSASALGSGVSIRVQGALMAIGTSDAGIRFALDPAIVLDLSEPLGHHQGVFTSDGGQITLSWCDYGGGNGIRLADLSGPVTVSNCELHDIPDSAISGGEGTDSKVTVEDNFIHHSETGVSVNAPGVIQRNCITNNRHGFRPGKNWGLTNMVKDNSIFDSTDLEVLTGGQAADSSAQSISQTITGAGW